MIKKLTENLMVLKMKINPKNAYLGVMGGSLAFAFSLFLNWTQAKTGINTIDDGYRTGWSECAYISSIPIIYILKNVVKDKGIKINYLLISFAFSAICIVTFNIVGRTEWVYANPLDNISTWPLKRNFGSDLGVGFWIGLISLCTVYASAISWAFHKEAENQN